MLGSFLQVVGALVVLFALLVFAFYIFNKEYVASMRTSGAVQQRVLLLDGIRDISRAQDVFITNNKDDSRYLALPLSQNQHAGAEMTYNFWLYIDTSEVPANNIAVKTDGGLTKSEVILFMRGVNKAFNYRNICNTVKKDVLVKCPLVKLESRPNRPLDVLSVEVNLASRPDTMHEAAVNSCANSSQDWTTKNSYKVAFEGLYNDQRFVRKWNMFTIVIQDTLPSDPLPFRNKVHVSIYINGRMELDRYIDNKLSSADRSASALLQNNGNFYVGPQIQYGTATTDKTYLPTADDKVKIADLAYYNYAIDQATIKSLYQGGFKKAVAAARLGSAEGDFPQGPIPTTERQVMPY